MPLRGLMMIRCLADEAEQARDAFVAIWKRLRPALAGLDPQPLRLWAT
jgi:urease accessory protein UreH